MASRSFAVSSPTCASMAEWALLPAMSNGARRQSNETDSLNCSINSAGPAVNRPPQVACEGLAMTNAEQTPRRGGAQRERWLPDPAPATQSRHGSPPHLCRVVPAGARRVRRGRVARALRPRGRQSSENFDLHRLGDDGLHPPDAEGGGL